MSMHVVKAWVGPSWSPWRIDNLMLTLSLMLLSLVNPAFGEIADLTELSITDLMNVTVYSASKFEQKLSETPSSVSIVTAEVIKQQGYRTIADILKNIRSFYVTNDRNYSYIGVRGFGRPGDYNSRILLLIDGHRTNDNVYNQAYIGTEALIDVDLIDRIEIIRGTGSSLYGSNAFFAVINIITRNGRSLKGVEAAAAGASFGTAQGRLTYGNQYARGTEVLASGTYYNSRGGQLYFPEFDQNVSAESRAANNGETNSTDYDRARHFFIKTGVGDLSLSGVYAQRTKGIPTGAYGIDFNEPGNLTIDRHAYGDAKYKLALGGGADLTLRLYYDVVAYEGDYLYAGVLNRDESYGSWWGSEVQLHSRVGESQQLILGAEFTDNLRQSQKNYDAVPYNSILDDVRRSRIWAAYLQDEITFARGVLLNAGVRYDHYDTFGGTMNPRLALIMALTEKTTVKLLAGSAFRAPNSYELYYQSSTALPNPDLKPEKIVTYELVLEKELGEGLRASLGGYYYKITDLIDYDRDLVSGLAIFRNLDQIIARGGEVEVEGRWVSGIKALGSYTIQRTENRATGEPLTNSPEQLAKASLSVPLANRKALAGIEEQYTSRRRIDGGKSIGGFEVTNLTVLVRDVVPRMELSASVYNVFDRRYGDPVAFVDFQPLETVQSDGRVYRVKLAYRF